MAQVKIAHLNQQGQNMIIIPLSRDYNFKTNAERNQIKDSFQQCATAAGLAGTVVTVWDAGNGRMGFLAPTQWRNFFSGLSLATVSQNLNKTLTCN